MKILSAEEIRLLDKFTISNEPIASIDFMERAATAFADAIIAHLHSSDKIFVFCGMGNNGGDGLAIARLLIERGFLHVQTYVVKHSPKTTDDFLKNEERLKHLSSVHYIETELQLPSISAKDKVIDAIFGIGLSRAVEGVSAFVINALNKSGASIFSVDIPSGLFCDKPNLPNNVIIKAEKVFTFHAPKLSFLLPSANDYVRDFAVLDIGLNSLYADSLASNNYYLQAKDIKHILKPRKKFSHKGTYGHTLICAGSYGKIGAATLSVKAALRSGTGLVTAMVPECGYEIMQVANPEAMISAYPRPLANKERELLTPSYLETDLSKYSAIGVGPGIGTESGSAQFLVDLFLLYKKPMVVDADALNILAGHKKFLEKLPENSILTPHPGEFKRLAGEWKDDLEKLELQRNFARKHKVVVVLKGAHTTIVTPEGKLYFNSTGNAGMAKGGSGDVLTGVISALLAQGYTAEEAAMVGVYVHGLAGDYAATDLGKTALTAGDIIRYLPKAFSSVEV
ncbi:MAG: NAD(P)H-hydrate dehydratase [Chitinophagales bacterium]